MNLLNKFQKHVLINGKLHKGYAIDNDLWQLLTIDEIAAYKTYIPCTLIQLVETAADTLTIHVGHNFQITQITHAWTNDKQRLDCLKIEGNYHCNLKIFSSLMAVALIRDDIFLPIQPKITNILVKKML